MPDVQPPVTAHDVDSFPYSNYYGVEDAGGGFGWSGSAPWPGEGYPDGSYPVVARVPSGPSGPGTPPQLFGYPTGPVADPLQGDPNTAASGATGATGGTGATG